MKTIMAGNNTYNLFYLRGFVSVGKQVACNSYVEIKEKFPSVKSSRAEICIVNQAGYPGCILITDSNGTTHSIYIREIDLVCLEHDEVIAIWCIEIAAKRGPVIAIKNLKTAQSFFADAQLKKMYRNTWIYIFCLLLAVLITALTTNYQCFPFTAAVAVAVAHAIKKCMAHRWADGFKKKFDFEVGW